MNPSVANIGICESPVLKRITSEFSVFANSYMSSLLLTPVIISAQLIVLKSHSKNARNFLARNPRRPHVQIHVFSTSAHRCKLRKHNTSLARPTKNSAGQHEKWTCLGRRYPYATTFWRPNTKNGVGTWTFLSTLETSLIARAIKILLTKFCGPLVCGTSRCQTLTSH